MISIFISEPANIAHLVSLKVCTTTNTASITNRKFPNITKYLVHLETSYVDTAAATSHQVHSVKYILLLFVV